MPALSDSSWAIALASGFDRAPAAPPLVLLAMRETPARESLQRALRRAGFTVTPVEDGWTLLDLVGGALFSLGAWQTPSLVVLDPSLPGPLTSTIVARIRAWLPDLPVVETGTRACQKLTGS